MKEFEDLNNMIYYEVSSKTGENLENTLNNIVYELLDQANQKACLSRIMLMKKFRIFLELNKQNQV